MISNAVNRSFNGFIYQLQNFLSLKGIAIDSSIFVHLGGMSNLGFIEHSLGGECKYITKLLPQSLTRVC